ncbi:MAG TPA: UDP-N-acetylglucosamine 2-epimerase (non-hydrolyzing) [Myxococcaceae bacterium]|nr:UDP-N-acetylglucosamine 2-epimerase (non-hydrolyzing) [Myxococcaceae bacterium]
MRQVLHVVGARPNFMKVAPLHRALARVPGITQRLIHTGQHHDSSMSDVFFKELDLPPPSLHLDIHGGHHGEATGRMLIELERICLELRPELISVVGDVNSTLAASLVAAKLQIPLAHVEAGLRSGDRSMPEEINRIVTDRLADLCLTPSPDADAHLRREGVEESRIRRVGNIMVDTLLSLRERALRRDALERLGLRPGAYALCTLHRASNVDSDEQLGELMQTLVEISERIPLVFPVHPRTAKALQRIGLADRLARATRLKLIEPQGYLDFLCLSAQARLVLTDSGGLQEETTVLGIPCLTLRNSTERPITVEEGTNQIVGTVPEDILAAVEDVLARGGKRGRVPALWDGHTAERIAQLYAELLDAPS